MANPRCARILPVVIAGAAATLAAASASGLSLHAQEAPRPAPRAAAPAPGEDDPVVGHKVRGVLAWRRAVWTSDAAAYTRATKELEAARAAGAGDDFTTLFLLGHSWTRLGDAKRAEGPLARARAIAPDFPGHILAQALLVSSDGPAVKRGPGTTQALDLLDEYLVAIAAYDRNAAFAAELEYLGHLERGLRQFANEAIDRGISDLGRAAEIATSERRRPATELTRTLAECHKRVNEHPAAERLLVQELKDDPIEASHYHVLGLVAADRRETTTARDWYRRALARRPDYAESRPKLAYLAHEAADLHEMRVQLEIYQSLMTARWIADPRSRASGTAANLHAAWGTYWRARGDRLMESGERERAAKFWRLARDSFLQANAEHPGCVRALVGLIQVLPFLDAPQEEIDRRKKEHDEIRDRKDAELAAYRDTFCFAPALGSRSAPAG